MATMNPLSIIHNSVTTLNNSRYFAGIVMLLLNIGSKYITFKFSKTQEEYLKNSFARELLIFSIIWMATRDIYTSILMTAAFIVLADFLFNENSRYCILPEKFKQLYNIIDADDNGIISDEEIKRAEDILNKEKKQKEKMNQLTMMSYMQHSASSVI